MKFASPRPMSSEASRGCCSRAVDKERWRPSVPDAKRDARLVLLRPRRRENVMDDIFSVKNSESNISLMLRLQISNSLAVKVKRHIAKKVKRW